MMAIAFDTLKYANHLKAAGIPEKHAEAIVEAQAEVFDKNLDELATKRDLKELEAATKRDLKELEAATKRDLKELEVKIAEAKASMIQWMFGVAAGQAAFIIAILKMFPSH